MLYLSGKKIPGRPLLLTPQSNYRVEPDVPWAVDNGCFTDSYPGDERFLEWLDKWQGHRSTCLFVACPDVLFDAAATLTRWRLMAPRLRERGWPVALVLQDGMTPEDVLEAAPDAVFVGGSTEFKLGVTARQIIAALPVGTHVHMGRVNSRKRMQYAHMIGCHSVDGTVLAFDQTRPVFRWAEELTAQTSL